MAAGRRRGRHLYRRKSGMCLRGDHWLQIWIQYYPAMVTITVACLLSGILISNVEERLRPVLLTAAQVQTKNAVTSIAETAIMSELERHAFGYADLVYVERNSDGMITAITTDMAAMNRLRSTLVEMMLEHLSVIDEEEILIPVGSLIDSELLWGRGPTIKARAFIVGTVSAEFRSEFSAAGVNQTLHKIMLELSVPMTVLLPGTQLEVCVDTALCIAETVIVGNVPSYVYRSAG